MEILESLAFCQNPSKRKILYAPYGSNLLRERFLVYIEGGKFRGKGDPYPGCRDKTVPIDRGWMRVPHRLYFAKKSKRWNGGVAFLSCRKEEDESLWAVVRLWEITEEQFCDIWEQEGKGWYHAVLYLGKHEETELEIYTITGCWEDEKNPPSADYLDVLREGLRETTGWDDAKIDEYLRKFI